MELRWPFYFISIVQFFILVGSSDALAKKIKIEWKPIEGAIRYEIQIQKDGAVLMTQATEDSVWKGELGPGAYAYQIRGIDLVKRPGLWSELRSLAVMPSAPDLKSPSDGSHLDLYHPKVETILKWDEIPGIKSYKVEILKEDQVISANQVNGTHLSVKELPAGKYRWRVKALVVPGGRSPASLQSRKWESKPSDEDGFSIEYKKLKSPHLKSPIGPEPVPDDKIIKLKWKEVEGAELYEVHLMRMKSGVPSKLNATKAFLTKDNTLKVKIPGEGRYLWGVRALANLDEKKVPQAAGTESMAQFNLDRNAVFNDDLGYLSLSTMLAPYQYSVVSPFNGGGGSTQSWAAVLRASGELWFLSQWGVSVAAERALFTIQNQTFNRDGYELLGKFRWKLSPGLFGWSIAPKVGLEVRDYNEITANNNVISNGLTNLDNYFLGITAGVDVRKQLSEKMSLGVKISYYIPISMISGPPSGATLGPFSTYRNLNIGIQGLYWLSRNWGVGVGGSYDLRSIGFFMPNSSASEQITMDATYFFGSIIYRFWK